MPGGGQLPLIAYGNQNRIVSGNPEMTYFYKVFRRYTHFSQESITIPVDGPQELRPDKPVRVRAKIPRHADLMTDLMLVLQLPEIYSKVNEQLQRSLPSFRWIHMIGAFMIANVAIIVGGSKVQEFPGEWLAVRATADMPLDKYLKWRSMVGDVPEMHSPEWGVYGKSPNYPFQKGEYPHSQADASSASIQVAPSINGRELRIPLPFWFTESIGTALPLVALQLHEVEVQIDFRPLTDIFRLMDEELQAEPVRPDMKLVVDPTKPTQMDPTVDPPPYDNLTLQNDYLASAYPCTTLRSFLAPPDVDDNLVRDTFPTNVHLEGNYIYLTEKERIIFAERELNHLVMQVQRFRYPSIRGRAQLDMDVHGLAHRIIFFARRSDALGARNDYINLSNWKSLAQAPYWPLSAASGVPNAGRSIQYYNTKHILRSARVLMAGNEIFEEKPVGYFELQTPFTSLAGSGATGLHPGAIKPDDIMGPLYHIPFALNASDHEQPSGSLNTSMVREIQLEVNPAPLDPAAPYSYDFTIYVETLNTVKFLNGMAGLAFAI